jgi:signal transduction histidine kinase
MGCDQMNERDKLAVAVQVNPEDIEKDLSEADEATRAKAAFIANISHELRTPLNAIMGFTDLLLFDGGLSSEQEEAVEIIKSSGEALLFLINDILDFAAIERGGTCLKEQPLDLPSCIGESINLVAPNAEEKGLKLSWIMDPDMPRMICGDRARLLQVLGNLLENAVKFTEAGEVMLSVTSEPSGSDCQIHFAVRDTGIGIPYDRMCCLFQSFSQVDDSMSRKYPGIGLGLAMSKKLVERMGGKIWAESCPECGSTFHFTIRARPIPNRSGLSAIRAEKAEGPIVCNYSINYLISGQQAAANSLEGCWRS